MTTQMLAPSARPIERQTADSLPGAAGTTEPDRTWQDSTSAADLMGAFKDAQEEAARAQSEDREAGLAALVDWALQNPAFADPHAAANIKDVAWGTETS